MRKVVVAEYVTLDGVMQDPGGVREIDKGGWSNPYWNDELAKYQSASRSRHVGASGWTS